MRLYGAMSFHKDLWIKIYLSTSYNTTIKVNLPFLIQIHNTNINEIWLFYMIIFEQLIDLESV